MSEIRKRLMAGAGWMYASRVGVNALGLIGTVVLARALTPADFGLVALGMTMIALMSAITDTSLSSALIQHENPQREHCDTALTLGLIRGGAAAAIFALAAYPVAAAFAEPRLVGVMQVLAFTLLLSGAENPRTVLMTKSLIFWQQFLLQVARKLGAFLVSVAIALAFHSYWALVIGAVAGQALGVAVSYMVFPYRPRFCLQHVGELLGFSVWLTLGQVVKTANWRIDNLLVAGYLGKPELGIYSVGGNLAALPTRETTTPLFSVLFPSLAHVARSPERLARNYQRAQSTITCIVFPLGIGLALIADPLIPLLLGERWQQAVLVVQFLAAVYAVQTLGSFAQPLAMAAGETKLLFVRDIQSFVLRVPIILAGILLAGLPGLLWGRVLSGTLAIGFNMLIVRKVTQIGFLEQFSVNARAMVAAGVMVCGVLLAQSALPMAAGIFGQWLWLATMILLGALLYIGSLTLLWYLAEMPDGPEREILRSLQVFGRRSARTSEQ